MTEMEMKQNATQKERFVLKRNLPVLLKLLLLQLEQLSAAFLVWPSQHSTVPSVPLVERSVANIIKTWL
jgi:hypothetical protein